MGVQALPNNGTEVPDEMARTCGGGNDGWVMPTREKYGTFGCGIRNNGGFIIKADFNIIFSSFQMK